MLRCLQTEPNFRNKGPVFTALGEQIHICVKMYGFYTFITCSEFNYCDQNVCFTEISRTQVTDDFVESFEQSVQRLRVSVTQ